MMLGNGHHRVLYAIMLDHERIEVTGKKSESGYGEGVVLAA
jgi:hypothetical protein